MHKQFCTCPKCQRDRQVKRIGLAAGLPLAAILAVIVLYPYLTNLAIGEEPETLEAVSTVIKPIQDAVTIDTNLTAYLIHQYTNEERQRYNIRSLSYDEELAQIATAHSKDMIAREFYDHDNPDGEDPSARAERAGYNCVKMTHVGIAENLTQGGSRFGDYTEEQMARAAVKGWMESEGHRFNILDFRYSKEGIGIAYNNLGNFAYITQNFC